MTVVTSLGASQRHALSTGSWLLTTCSSLSSRLSPLSVCSVPWLTHGLDVSITSLENTGLACALRTVLLELLMLFARCMVLEASAMLFTITPQPIFGKTRTSLFNWLRVACQILQTSVVFGTRDLPSGVGSSTCPSSMRSLIRLSFWPRESEARLCRRITTLEL